MTEITVEKIVSDGLASVANADRADLCDRGDAPLRPLLESRDDRFRRLLAPAAWISLPAAVRDRFSRHLRPGQARIFAGGVVVTELSPLGRVLAAVARLAGGPLPTGHGATGPAIVSVTEDEAAGGQIWSRSYARAGRFPQVIHSVKRFGGPTGLEEYLGFGLVMRLVLHAEGANLVFRSTGYAVRVLGREMALPRWASPGTCEIRHRDEGGGWFSFTLSLTHGWAGRLVHQVARFREVPG